MVLVHCKQNSLVLCLHFHAETVEGGRGLRFNQPSQPLIPKQPRQIWEESRMCCICSILLGNRVKYSLQICVSELVTLHSVCIITIIIKRTFPISFLTHKNSNLYVLVVAF